MDWLRTFGSEGFYFPAFVVAFGSLVLLCRPFQTKLTPQQIEEASPWYRWLLRHDWEKWGAWVMVSGGIFDALLKVAMRG